MKKIINFYFDERIKNKTRIKLVKKYKFDGIFLMCDDQFDENVKLARKFNLFIETAHLPYRNLCNNIWLDSKLGDEFTESIINWIRRLSKVNIKIAVMHPQATKNPPAMSTIGIERLKKIVKVCEEVDVYLALENIHNWTYVLKPLDIIHSNHLGICLDFGHANAFTKNIYDINFSKITPRVFCAHMHDNFGKFDEHLVPFDGNIDFKYMLRELKNNGFKGNITLELESELHYKKTNVYLSKAITSAERLKDMYENE